MKNDGNTYTSQVMQSPACTAGLVQLVGAGPGDPELLTVKAFNAIQTAEVVVYDRLVSAEILRLIPHGAERIDVGKAPRRHPVPQEDINARLVALARRGLRVVRLKGGDPFLFGRGGEEAIALAAAGVAFEVIPGITSAQGAAASLRMPLTHRELASGVRLLTGHRRGDGELDFDWKGLADPATTLVVYMALASISEIAAALISNGRDARTPVLAVSHVTRSNETRLYSTLATIARDVSWAGLEAPVLFVIGEVVAIAQFMQRATFSCPAAEAIDVDTRVAVAAE